MNHIIMEIEEFLEKSGAFNEDTKDQGDALIKMYKLIIPDWDKVVKVNGYPTVSSNFWKAICSKFQEFDKKHHPEIMPGGIWMNRGFSCDYKLKDNVIDLSGIEVEYDLNKEVL